MFLLTLFAAFFIAGPVVFSQIPFPAVDEMCIACICEAASACNTTTKCQGDTCGLFKITQPYWVDAGKPVIPRDDPNSTDAWVRCATEPYCAALTVQMYLTKFQKDCNNDGHINCNDFASIHHLGPYGCTSGTPWNKEFEFRFMNCLRSFQIVFG